MRTLQLPVAFQLGNTGGQCYNYPNFAEEAKVIVETRFLGYKCGCPGTPYKIVK